MTPRRRRSWRYTWPTRHHGRLWPRLIEALAPAKSERERVTRLLIAGLATAVVVAVAIVVLTMLSSGA